MSETHPLFSTIRVLKPPQGFEAVYQGQPTTVPVTFPGTLDPLAGKEGFDPFLTTGVPVPFGARIALYIPMTLSSGTEGAQPTTPYEYVIGWRLRSVQDFLDTQGLPPNEQKQYSVGEQQPGLPTAGGSPRVIIPCGFETVAYEQLEPGSNFANGVVHLRGLRIVPDAHPTSRLPLTVRPSPGTPMLLSQGAFVDNGSDAEPVGINWVIYETTASGNELFIVARREDPGDNQTWDFSQTDRSFSNTYGTDDGNHAFVPQMGIYLITGSP